MEKKCTKCGKKLSLKLFFRDIQKKDGLTSSCKECIRRQTILSYDKRREQALKYAKKYYTKNKEKQIKRQRELRKKLVGDIFEILGNKCKICGFNNKIALQIDHLNGSGYKHRKISGGGMTYYRQIKNKLQDYQLLCANCNFIEGVKKKYRKSLWS